MSDTPTITARLEAIEHDLAIRQPALEAAARAWAHAKRDRESEHAKAFIAAEGTVAERTAIADQASSLIGVEAEAEWEALRAVVRTLETRASVGQSLLRAQQSYDGFHAQVAA